MNRKFVTIAAAWLLFLASTVPTWAVDDPFRYFWHLEVSKNPQVGDEVVWDFQVVDHYGDEVHPGTLQESGGGMWWQFYMQVGESYSLDQLADPSEVGVEWVGWFAPPQPVVGHYAFPDENGRFSMKFTDVIGGSGNVFIVQMWPWEFRFDAEDNRPGPMSMMKAAPLFFATSTRAPSE